jgi:hypothetical protein
MIFAILILGMNSFSQKDEFQLYKVHKNMKVPTASKKAGENSKTDR